MFPQKDSMGDMKLKIFSGICIAVGLLTILLSMFDSEFMDRVFMNNYSMYGRGHIVYAVFGIPGILALGGIQLWRKNAVGRDLFFIYTVLLAGWIVFNAIFLRWVFAFNIFNSSLVTAVHILLAISGLIFLCFGTGGDKPHE